MSAPALSPAYFQKKSTDELIAARNLVEDILDFRARQFSLFDPPKPVLVSPTPAAPPELASVLSPSQKRCFTDCQYRWWAKYGLELPETRTAALGLGSAFHHAIAENFRQKIETKQDLDPMGTVSIFKDAWLEQADTVQFAADEDHQEISAMGSSMVRKYMDEVAPTIQPAAVELHVQGEIAGVQVHGYVDLLDVNGTIIDTKTASKKPHGISPDHRFQIVTYSQLLSPAPTSGVIDTITKCKTIGTVRQSFAIEAADVKEVVTTYPLVQAAMRSGLYVANRNSNLCSRKNCSFWRNCEDANGGRVRE